METRGLHNKLKIKNGKLKCAICEVEKNIYDFVPRLESKTGFRGKCRKCYNAKVKAKWQEVRTKVFNYYGWKCNCCGEKITEFLTIDHINNDGHKDKHPNTFQTLCHNCNFVKSLYKGCPHKLNART